MPLVLKPAMRASEIDELRVKQFQEELNIDALTARILVSRGFKDTDECKKFLFPDENLLHDPFEIKNMTAVIDMITRIKEQNKKICIYGDYDVDGTCATAILFTALKRFGVNAGWYIPSRREGYGLNKAAVGKIYAEYDAIITVDCGISSFDLIHEIIGGEKEIIVTDHHSIGEKFPECTVLKPGQPGDGYKNPDLCGAGVAFKIACALLGENALDLMDYAAVATVADIVPLKDENRFLVQNGLKMLNSSPRPCFKALLDAADFAGTVTSQTVGFVIAPRINAAGRMADASLAMDLLLGSENLDERAEKLCELNLTRQETEKSVLAAAEDFIIKNGTARDYKVIVVAGENWDEGVLGICAARLLEKYNRPCLVFSINGDTAKGSGRSVEGIDLFELLTAAKDCLIQFGGHKAAAGMTVKTDNLAALNKKLDSLLRENYDLINLYPAAKYDVKAKISEITLDFVRGLERFQPCGADNPEVTLRIDNGLFSSVKPVGKEKNHLKLTLQDDTGQAGAMAFFFEKQPCDYFTPVRDTVIVKPQKNEWQNKESVSLIISNVKPAEDIKPRQKAGELTAAFYSRLALKGEKPPINVVDDPYDLAFMISQWDSDDISGTLVLCDHPEYAAGFISLAREEFPRFDISYSVPKDNFNGYNCAVFGANEDKINFMPFKRIVFYDLLNHSYAGKIKMLAPHAELYALKCNKDLFSSIFEEYKQIDRENMLLAYKSICACEGIKGSRAEILSEISERKQINMPLLSVAADTFSELGFINFNGCVKINRDAQKRDLKESKFYTGLLSCLMNRI